MTNHTNGQIVLLSGSSQHGSLNYFIEDLAKAFHSLGYQAPILALNDPDIANRLQQVLNEGNIRFFLGMNGWSFNIEVNQKPFFDAIGVPLVMWFFDHPYYHFATRLATPIENLRLAFVFQNGLTFAQQFMDKPCPKGFIPHGGSARFESPKPFAAREWDLVFFGTLGNLEKVKQSLQVADKRLQEAIWQTIEAAKSAEGRPLDELLLNSLYQVGLTSDSFDPRHQFITLVSRIDEYLRITYRKELLASMKEQPIYVCGDGWEQLEQTNLRLIPPQPFPAVIEMMNNTKVVLNNLTPFYTGGHERIFYAMLQGAVCLSDPNPWLETQFQEGQHILFYRGAPEAIEEQVRALFRHPDELAHIAEGGRQVALESHTWLNRAKALIALVEAQTQAKIGEGR